MPEEHAGLMAAALADRDLWVSIFAGDPPGFRLLDRVGTPSIPAGCQAVVFTASEPDLDVRSMYQFAVRNSDALILEIGDLTASGLGESHLSTMTRDPDLVRRWRAVAKPVKAALLAGAIAFRAFSDHAGSYPHELK